MRWLDPLDDAPVYRARQRARRDRRAVRHRPEARARARPAVVAGRRAAAADRDAADDRRRRALRAARSWACRSARRSCSAPLLAPTDPVLAGDVGVGPPGDEDEREPNFSITGEAGLNDGLAFPFVLLGILVAGDDASGRLVRRLAARRRRLRDRSSASRSAPRSATAIAALAVRLRDRELLAHALDGWLAIAAVLSIYGATEIAGAYGFLAAFAGGVAFRRYEHGHEYNRRVHDGAEIVEKFGELALDPAARHARDARRPRQAPGSTGWLLAPLLLVVIRPVARRRVALVRTALPGARARVRRLVRRARDRLALLRRRRARRRRASATSEATSSFWTVAVVRGRLDRRPRHHRHAAQPPLAAQPRRPDD